MFTASDPLCNLLIACHCHANQPFYHTCSDMQQWSLCHTWSHHLCAPFIAALLIWNFCLTIIVPARSSNHFQAIAYVHYLEPTTTCLWRSSYYKMGYIQVEDNIEKSIVSMSVSLKAAWGRLPVGVFRLSTLIRLLWLSIAISCPFSGSVEWGKVISACGLRWETVCQKPR